MLQQTQIRLQRIWLKQQNKQKYLLTQNLQREKICLGTFCEKNYTAIINHSDVRNIDGRGHRVVVNWWNILSVKCLSQLKLLTINYKLWYKIILMNGQIRLYNLVKLLKESVTSSLPGIVLWQYITHTLILSVCADLYSESLIIMIYWEYFQQTLRQRIREAAPRIWWNVLYNCSKSQKRWIHPRLLYCYQLM